MAETDAAGSDYLIDPQNECLLRGAEEVPLRPKTFAVLKHLVSQRGRLVTKTQLLDSVWTNSYVSDMVLKVSIRELRKALEDDFRAPRYIQTHHGRGYRFIGRLDVAAPPSPLRGRCLKEPSPRVPGDGLQGAIYLAARLLETQGGADLAEKLWQWSAGRS